MKRERRRPVVSSRQLTGLHRTYELQLGCGHTREWRMGNRSIPATSRCTKCEQGEAAPRPDFRTRQRAPEPDPRAVPDDRQQPIPYGDGRDYYPLGAYF